jgi:peroxiredoxin
MSPRSRFQTRKLVAITIVGAACLLLAVQYVRLVPPAAAREIQAACTGLRPSAVNPAFGSLPTQGPVDFTAQDHNGNMVKLSDYRGKVVFVNFWATWCNVCKAEKPGLERMSSELQSNDFVVLSLASDPSWDLIREHFPDGSPLNILLDPPLDDDTLGEIAKSFGIKAVPESFVIDREGRIRRYFINKRDWDSGIARTCLKALVQES